MIDFNRHPELAIYQGLANRIASGWAVTGPVWSVKRRYQELWQLFLEQTAYIQELTEIIEELDGKNHPQTK